MLDSVATVSSDDDEIGPPARGVVDDHAAHPLAVELEQRGLDGDPGLARECVSSF